MLWDIIRDFIVQYITGGYTSSGEGYSCSLGTWLQDDSEFLATTGDLDVVNFGVYQMGLGDWLATTITIICMCAIVFFGYWLVRWIFKAVSSAFLLK